MSRGGAAIVLVVLAACGQPAPHAQEQHTSLGGGTVARVDGRPITTADVEAELRSGGGTPREALDRVVDARILARYAAANGYAARTDVERTARRLAVQELLARDVEGAVTPASITDAELQGAYDGAGTRFRAPERRAASQVLVLLDRSAPPDRVAAARSLAEEARIELASSTNLDAVLDAWRERGAETGFGVRCEVLPLAAADGSFVHEFEEALFAIDAAHLPSVATSVVRTQYGFHAVALREVEAARATPLASVASQLRDELVVRHRRERLRALLTELASRTPPEADPHVAERVAAAAP